MGKSVAVVLFVLAAAAAWAADDTLPARGIRGEVFLPDGTPVAGVKVVAVRVKGSESALPEYGPRYETRTEPDGTFRFDNLPYGNEKDEFSSGYAVRAWSAEGAAEADSWWVEASSIVRPLLVELKPAGALSGVVRDEHGKPVAGATVYPHERREDGEPLEPLWSSVQGVETDAQGRFRLEGLFTGDWRLCIVAKSHATAISNFYPVGTDDIEVMLRSGGRVEGRMVPLDGAHSVAGAKVLLASRDLYRNTRRIEADSAGRFLFEGVTPGRYVATIEHAEYVTVAPAEVEVLEAESSEGIEIPVVRGGRITGRITKEGTGAPLAGILVEGRPEGVYDLALGDDYGKVRAFTESDGRYRLQGLLPRDNRLNIRSSAELLPFQEYFRWAYPRLSKDAENMDIVLPKGVVLRGRVVDETGAPAAGAVVSSWSKQGGSERSVPVGQDGSVILEVLPSAGELRLQADTEGAWSDPLTVDVGQEDITDLLFTLHPATASISGFVKNSEGRPRSDARVSATFQDYGGGTGEVGSGGFFKIGRLIPGTYRIGIDRQGRIAPTVAEVTLKAEEARNDLLLTYDAAGPEQPEDAKTIQPDPYQGNPIRVSGRVTDTQGRPIAGATVRESSSSHSAVTDGEGRYKLLAGWAPQRIWIYREGYAPFQTLASNGMGVGTRENPQAVTFDTVLQPPGRIEGQVIDSETAQPVKSFRLQLSNSFVPARYTVGENGRFVLEDLPAGDVSFEIRAKGYFAQQRGVNMTSGGTVKDLIVHLAPLRNATGTVKDMDGRPLPGAEIRYASLRDDGTLMSVGELLAVAGAEGRFTVDSLPTDAKAVRVHCPDFVDATCAVNKGPIEVALLRAAVIRGRVTVGGKPAPMSLSIKGLPEMEDRRNADGAGLFRMPLQGEGKATLEIGTPQMFGLGLDEFGGMYDPSVIHRFERVIQVDREKPLELELALPALNAAIEGTLGKGERPPVAFKLVYRSEEVDGLREYYEIPRYESHFRLNHLAAGNGTISLEVYNGSVLASIPVTLKAGETLRIENGLAVNLER